MSDHYLHDEPCCADRAFSLVPMRNRSIMPQTSPLPQPIAIFPSLIPHAIPKLKVHSSQRFTIFRHLGILIFTIFVSLATTLQHQSLILNNLDFTARRQLTKSCQLSRQELSHLFKIASMLIFWSPLSADRLSVSGTDVHPGQHLPPKKLSRSI